MDPKDRKSSKRKPYIHSMVSILVLSLYRGLSLTSSNLPHLKLFGKKDWVTRQMNNATS